MMKLDINFRETAYRRERQKIIIIYLSAAMMLLFTLYLFVDYRQLSVMNEERVIRISALREQQAQLTAEREKLKPVATELNRSFVDYESLLGRYLGRVPDEILYDLEKTVPEGVYVTNLTYDRITGIALVNAVSNRPEHITKILTSLEQMADYSQVLLTSQAEMEEKGKIKFVFKIVDNGKVGRDES